MSSSQPGGHSLPGVNDQIEAGISSAQASTDGGTIEGAARRLATRFGYRFAQLTDGTIVLEPSGA